MAGQGDKATLYLGEGPLASHLGGDKREDFNPTTLIRY